MKADEKSEKKFEMVFDSNSNDAKVNDAAKKVVKLKLTTVNMNREAQAKRYYL